MCVYDSCVGWQKRDKFKSRHIYPTTTQHSLNRTREFEQMWRAEIPRHHLVRECQPRQHAPHREEYVRVIPLRLLFHRRRDMLLSPLQAEFPRIQTVWINSLWFVVYMYVSMYECMYVWILYLCGLLFQHTSDSVLSGPKTAASASPSY